MGWSRLAPLARKAVSDFGRRSRLAPKGYKKCPTSGGPVIWHPADMNNGLPPWVAVASAPLPPRAQTVAPQLGQPFRLALCGHGKWSPSSGRFPVGSLLSSSRFQWIPVDSMQIIVFHAIFPIPLIPITRHGCPVLLFLVTTSLCQPTGGADSSETCMIYRHAHA